jgi:hypothetical protein
MVVLLSAMVALPLAVVARPVAVVVLLSAMAALPLAVVAQPVAIVVLLSAMVALPLAVVVPMLTVVVLLWAVVVLLAAADPQSGRPSAAVAWVPGWWSSAAAASVFCSRRIFDPVHPEAK